MTESPARPKIFDDPSTHTEVVGTRKHPMRDFYHWLLRGSWARLIGTIAAFAFSANLVFGLAYYLTGGVANAAPDSFWDSFFFSVHTIGTIGYGSMYPVTKLAQTIVSLESLASTILTALATGLVFSKFSAPSAKVRFSKLAVLCPYDGTPTLIFRLRNERGDYIVDAQLRVFYMRMERTKDGHSMYRFYDMALSRDRSPIFTGAWTAMHPINPQSPLFERSPEQLETDEGEIIISLVGVDSTTGQTINARHSYLDTELRWNHRFVDMVSEIPNSQKIRVDLNLFDSIKPL